MLYKISKKIAGVGIIAANVFTIVVFLQFEPFKVW